MSILTTPAVLSRAISAIGRAIGTTAGSGGVDVETDDELVEDVPTSLIVGRAGIVRTPGGTYLGADDAVSFEVADYADRMTCRLAAENFLSELDSSHAASGAGLGALLAKRAPAQYHALMEEKWRRLMNATKAFRTPARVHISSAATTFGPAIKGSNPQPHRLYINFVSAEGVETSVCVEDSKSSLPMLRTHVYKALRERWEMLNSTTLDEIAAEFDEEAGLKELSRYPFDEASRGIAIRLLRELQWTSAQFRQQSAWRAGFDMDSVHAAVSAFYDQLDRQVLSLATSLFALPAWLDYLAIRGVKDACSEAIVRHGGLAALHFPTSLLVRAGGFTKSTSKLEAPIASIRAAISSGLTPIAKQMLSDASPRYLISAIAVLLSTAEQEGCFGSGMHQEVGIRFAGFLNGCAELGFLPAQSMLRLPSFHFQFCSATHLPPAELEAGRKSLIDQSVATAQVIAGLATAKRWSIRSAIRHLGAIQAAVTPLALKSGESIVPTPAAVIALIDQMNPGGDSSFDALAEQVDRRVRPREIAQNRCARLLQARLSPIPASDLGIKGMSPKGGQWVPTVSADESDGYTVTYVLHPRPKGRRPLSLICRIQPARASGLAPSEFAEAELARAIAAGGVVVHEVEACIGQFAGIEAFSAAEAKKNAKSPKSRNSSEAADLEPEQRALVPNAIFTQLGAMRVKEPHLYHALLSTDLDAVKSDLAVSRIRSSRVLESALKVALSSRGDWTTGAIAQAGSAGATQSIIGHIVDRLAAPLRLDANGRSLLQSALDVASPSGVRHLYRALESRVARESADCPEGPRTLVQQLVPAIETALARKDPALLEALLVAEPELSQEHMDAFEAWHHSVQAPQLRAHIAAGIMRSTIRATRASALAPVADPAQAEHAAAAPISRRRAVAL